MIPLSLAELPPGRVDTAPGDADSITGVPLRRIGIVGGAKLGDVPLETLREAWEGHR